MSDTQPLLIDEMDDIFVVTLNRPKKLNAINGDMLRLLEPALHRFRDVSAFKVMLIRANGRYFSAGADIREGSPDTHARTGSSIREKHRIQLNGMQRIYDEMEHIEKPIVAAHHAPCVGGGLEMSLSCDFRLAAKSAHYSFPESHHGVLPASNGVSRLTRICGTHWARYMIMANRIVSAERALIMGLVHEVFPDETFEADVTAFCRHLAAQNGEQMGTAKIAIELARDLGLAQARHVERMANSSLMLSPTWADGMKDFVRTVGKDRPEGSTEL